MHLMLLNSTTLKQRIYVLKIYKTRYHYDLLQSSVLATTLRRIPLIEIEGYKSV